MTRRTLVVCIGNGLVADDAAGCAVHERLAAAGPFPDARLRLLGLGSLELLDELDGEDLLVLVDAVRFGAAPGTVHLREWSELPETPRAAVSVHGIGPAEALAMGRRLAPERMPGRVVLVGIEGCCFDRVGEAMTPAVAAAVDRAAREVLRLVRGAA